MAAISVAPASSDLLQGNDYRLPTSKIVYAKTQAVCTLGAASSSKKVLAQLLENGMTIARINMSHGSHELFATIIASLSQASAETGVRCATVMDVRGPEIRLGNFGTGEGVQLRKGQKFVFRCNHVEGDATQVTILSWTLWKHAQPGDKIIVDYGLVSFTVVRSVKYGIETTVDNDAYLGSRKHVVFKSVKPVDNFRKELLSYRDTQDIAFAVRMGVDVLAVPYCRGEADLDEIRSLPGVRESKMRVFVKINSADAVKNFDQLLDVADGAIMFRSDLAVQVPIERLASIQKMLLRKMRSRGKPLVIINHVLNSMVDSVRPNRAEATDVANMVVDGADAVALTQATASGHYPVATLRMLKAIMLETEKTVDYRSHYVDVRNRSLATPDETISLSDSLASSAVKTAWDIEASLLIVFTMSGQAAMTVSKYHPHCPIVCVTSEERTARYVCLLYGCLPFVVGSVNNTDDVVEFVLRRMRDRRLTEIGDNVVVMTGKLGAAVSGDYQMSVVTVG